MANGAAGAVSLPDCACDDTDGIGAVKASALLCVLADKNVASKHNAEEVRAEEDFIVLAL